MNWKILAVVVILGYITSVNGLHFNSPWYSEEYNDYSEFNHEISPQKNDHPCDRECISGDVRTCYYEFVVHYYEVASRICAMTGNNTNKGCILSDGVPTGVMVVNRQLDGPKIVACENDTVIVDVINNLREETTIHWHGLHMKDTPDMDGAPYVTQYPIDPGQSFRYKFYLKQHGTFWWHSHSFFQRAFGVAGALIVRQPKELEPHGELYDYDKTEHVVFLQDWFYNFTSDTPTNALINGKGHNNITMFLDRKSSESINYERFEVERGRRYRFRVIYNGNANCPLEFSIDNHDLLVMNSDSFDTETLSVKSIILLAAERYDFILYTSRPVRNYWMRVKGLGFCESSQILQTAIIQYKGAPKLGLPNRELSYAQVVTGLQLNPIDVGPSDDPNNLTISEINSLESTEWGPNTQFTTYYTKLSLYNRNGEFGFTIDDIFFMMPPISLLQARFLDIESTFCNRSSLVSAGRNCSAELCMCLNIIQVPLKDYVEFFVYTDMARGHPFHSHGMDFRVVGTGVVSAEDIANIETIDAETPYPRRTDRTPAIKDTVQVPGVGYTIIRMKTTNPGYWMFHCHLSVHSEEGMMAVLKVGENDQMLPTPLNNCYRDKSEQCIHAM